MSLWLGRHLLLYLPTSLDTSGLGGWVLPILAIALAVGGGGHSLVRGDVLCSGDCEGLESPQLSGHQRGAQPGCAWERGQTKTACVAGALGGWELGYPCKHSPPPLSAAAVSGQRAASGRRKTWGAGLHSPPPERPGLPHQRPRAGTKARGRAASPQRLLCSSGQSREKDDGGPQGNQDAVPALPERKAQAFSVPGVGIREAPETPARGARRGLQGGQPEGPPRRGEPQRPPPCQGSPAYLAGSYAPCCPSLRRGAALAAVRSGRTEANYAVGRGPGTGSGSRASRLHGRAGRLQLGRKEAEPPARARRLRPRLPPPPTARGGAGPRPPHLLKVCTGRREGNCLASRPRRSRARVRKARWAAGCPQGAGLVSLLAFHGPSPRPAKLVCRVLGARGWGGLGRTEKHKVISDSVKNLKTVQPGTSPVQEPRPVSGAGSLLVPALTGLHFADQNTEAQETVPEIALALEKQDKAAPQRWGWWLWESGRPQSQEMCEQKLGMGGSLRPGHLGCRGPWVGLPLLIVHSGRGRALAVLPGSAPSGHALADPAQCNDRQLLGKRPLPPGNRGSSHRLLLAQRLSGQNLPLESTQRHTNSIQMDRSHAGHLKRPSTDISLKSNGGSSATGWGHGNLPKATQPIGQELDRNSACSDPRIYAVCKGPTPSYLEPLEDSLELIHPRVQCPAWPGPRGA
ncbi:hypothetical protein Cadr_000025753 [Camelus dromedarius]|uniref:Uncharacterized protein n=1 Tax=Camelus dromedarius TaxID=9838 RepID=A0A5N4CMI9_CAMDR|nr:hypothetical protein Cadr_000025753 [Camelus dromedarius]